MTAAARLWRPLLGIAFVGLWLACFGGGTIRLFPQTIKVLQPADIGKEQNNQNTYYTKVPEVSLPLSFLELGVDGPEGGLPSNLQLFENGVKLGPPHILHNFIEQLGGGRYSHWGRESTSFVFFSTSDNTDPRANGRSYKIVVGPQLPAVLFVLVVLPLSAVLLQFLLSPWLTIASLALAGSALASWIWLFAGHLMLHQDSMSYTGWVSLVPLGYPLFLSAIKTLFGSYFWVSTIQISLLVAACLFLALAVAKVTNHQAAGFVTLLLLLSYWPMVSTSGQMLSEALFVPLLLVHVGTAMHLAVEARPRYAILLAVTAALIMFVRPAGYFVLAGVGFLAVAYHSNFRWVAIWVGVPILACILMTFTLNLAIRDHAAPSQVGRLLFPHIAFLFQPEYAAEPDKEFAFLIDEALKPHRAGFKQASSSIGERYRYSAQDYNNRLVATDRAVNTKFLAEKMPYDPEAYFRRLDALYVRLFLRTIQHDPIGYLGIIRDQIIGGWQIGVWADWGLLRQTYLTDAIKGRRIGAYIIREQKLPLSEDALIPDLTVLDRFPGVMIDFFEQLDRRIHEQARVIQFIGLLTLLAIPIAAFRGRRSPRWLALGYCGVIIHGSMLLAAAVTVFIARYAMPVEPIMLAAGVIITDGLLSWCAGMGTTAAGKLWARGTGVKREGPVRQIASSF